MKDSKEKSLPVIINKILIGSMVIFFYAICIINSMSEDRIFSENENRPLEVMPEFSVEALLSGEYMKSFDSYASDQFMSRDFFVSLKTNSEKLMMKNESNGVLFASDDYLIEPPVSNDSTTASNNILAIRNLSSLERFNITTCIVPTAFEIHNDKLPAFSYNTSLNTLQNDIKKEFKNTSVKVADVTEPLRERKEEYIFFRTDHHQTALGSYIVYSQLGNKLGYTPYQESDFEVTTLSDKFYGTTWSKAMLFDMKPDTIYQYKLKDKNISCKVSFPLNKTHPEMESLYQMSRLDTKDKYSVYLDGVHPIEVITSDCGTDMSIAVIKDSYAHSLMPFLANHYSEIHMIDMRYCNNDIVKYLDDNQIQNVLILYNAATFMTDPSLQRLTSYSNISKEEYKHFGIVGETEPVGESYFDDALFLGDSLTDGLRLYSPLTKPKFLAGTGISFKGVYESPLYDNEKTAFDYIKEHKPKKIYIMLGINYRIFPENLNAFVSEYTNLINDIRDINPDAYIYIQSLLPVTEERSSSDKMVNNKNIDLYNTAIEEMAKKNKCFYLAVNEIFKNSSGAMDEESTFDGVHPNRELYTNWVEYLKTHTVPDGKVSFDREKAQLSDIGKLLYEVAGKIESEVSFAEDLSMIDIDTARVIYPLDTSIVSDIVVMSGSGATADEIAVFKLAGTDYTTVTNVIRAHLDAKKADFKTYIPKEAPKYDNAVIITSNNTVIMCVTSDYQKAKFVIEKYINEV